MTEEIPIMYYCVGGFVLLLLLVVVFLILRNKPFVYRKSVGEHNTTLTLVANRDIHKIKVRARFGKEGITFERKRIRKGQTIDFTYPSSDKPTTVTVEVNPGKPKDFEV